MRGVEIFILIVVIIAVAVYIVHSAYMAGHWVGYEKGADDQLEYNRACQLAGKPIGKMER